MPFLPRAAAAFAALLPLAFGQGVVAPYADQFESPTWPGPEWTISTTSTSGRVVTATPSPVSPAGGLAVNFDVSAANTFSTNTLTIGVDLSGPSLVRLRYWAKETSDETHVEDGLFLAATPAGPFVKVVDHATLTAAWQEIVLDLKFHAALNGLAIGSNFQVRFSWRDNYPTPSDGLQIDSLRFEPFVAGQPNSADAFLDINGAAEPVGLVGPFEVSVAAGAPIVMTLTAPAGRAYALLAGPLGVGNFTLPGLGSLDIGSFSGSNLTDVVIVLDGTQPGLLNSLAVTGPAGVSQLSFPTPALPPGVWTTFQAVVFASPVSFKLTAAHVITVL